MNYTEAVTEFRELDEQVEAGQWRQAQIIWEQVEAGASRVSLARDTGKSDKHIGTLYLVWASKSTSNSSVTFNEAYQVAAEGEGWQGAQAIRRARSATSKLPAEEKAALADDLIDELPPERQASIVGKWLSEPANADEVMKSPEARSHAIGAIDRKERSEFKPGPVLDPGPNPDPFRLLYDLRRVHRIMVDIASQVSQRGNIVSAEEGDLVMEEIEWLTNTLSMIKSGISSGTLDDAIDRILAGDGLS